MDGLTAKAVSHRKKCRAPARSTAAVQQKRTAEAGKPSDLKTVGVAVQFPSRDVLLVLIPLLALES